MEADVRWVFVATLLAGCASFSDQEAKDRHAGIIKCAGSNGLLYVKQGWAVCRNGDYYSIDKG